MDGKRVETFNNNKRNNIKDVLRGIINGIKYSGLYYEKKLKDREVWKEDKILVEES